MSRLSLSLLVLSLVFASPIRAQVIRSYEGLDRNAVDGWFAQTQLSLDGRAGNASYLDLGLTGGLSYRVPAPGHWLRFYPSWQVRRSGGQSVVREWSAHFRHSFVFSDEMRTYAFAQIQADRSINLDRRVLVGGGLRRQIVPLGGGGLDIGLGLMLEDETLASGESTQALRGANLFSARGRAGIVRVLVTGFYQPIMSNLEDYRLSVDAEVQIPVSERVGFVISGSWRRDSRPPTDIEADDAGFGFSVRLSTR